MPYAYMRGDVEKVAGLTVKEPDRGAIACLIFLTREDIDTGRTKPPDVDVSLWSDRKAMPEAAE